MTPLSKASKKRMIKALENASVLVSRETYFGICRSINCECSDRTITPDEMNYLHQWIQKMLGDWTMLESWMRAQYPSSQQYGFCFPDKRLAATRQAWIAWMIVELKKS